MMGSVEHHDDELAEIDLTEDEIDAMMAAGEPVDIVGSSAPGPTMRFELYADAARRYRWRLVSDTDQVLATSTTVFITKREALRAIEAVARAASHAALVDRTGRAS